MDILKKILNSVLMTLFIEAVLFAPVVIMVATVSDISRTMKYLIPFLIALLPYIIIRKAKIDITNSRHSIFMMILALVASICFLVYFSGLTLFSFAGHPPY
jgi:uncharacterized membrane protein (GlpM family)